MNLPIDVIPNTNPPRFRWRQRVTLPVPHTTVCEGQLPHAVEEAVLTLIILAKQQAREIETLKKRVEFAHAPSTKKK